MSGHGWLYHFPQVSGLKKPDPLRKLIYTILPPSSDCGPITALQPTPVLSVLAIAYSNGVLIIHDVQSDKTILQLNSGSTRKSRIDSISFRTDGQGAGEDGRKDGVMATA